jgi:hypothetical protein
MSKICIAIGRHWDALTDPEFGRHAFENLAVNLFFKQIAIFQYAHESGWAERNYPELAEQYGLGYETLIQMPQIAPQYTTQPYPPMKEGLSIQKTNDYYRLYRMYQEVPLQLTSDMLQDLLDKYLYHSTLNFCFVMHKMCIAAGRYWDAQTDPEFGRHAFENLAIHFSIKQKAVIQFAFEKELTNLDFGADFAEGISKMQEEEGKRHTHEKPILEQLKHFFKKETAR